MGKFYTKGSERLQLESVTASPMFLVYCASNKNGTFIHLLCFSP